MPKQNLHLPWWPRDFLASTRGWSVTAKGVYRECLDAQWDLGDLPASAADLQALIGATDAEWAGSWSKVEPKLPLTTWGTRRNPRLELHREEVLALLNARSVAGQAGNAKRWGKPGNGSLSDHTAIANGSQSDRQAATDLRVAKRSPPTPTPTQALSVLLTPEDARAPARATPTPDSRSAPGSGPLPISRSLADLEHKLKSRKP